ncbi:ATP-binding cassette domain-containing protein [Achromobacter xylosoxidans]|uniref:ATP-binding cassette domain-containing protein n=1 Tax=Alcaligenes xylosoxydans xylosoxydans TaxID=85698 RepID=UPI00398ADCB5
MIVHGQRGHTLRVVVVAQRNPVKSILLNIIAGVTTPDSGDVWIDGHSLTHAPQQAKARLIYAPDNCLAFPTQTGRGLLEQAAAEKNVALDEATLALAYDPGLEPHLGRRFEQMSTGTRRKGLVTAAILGDPAVLAGLFKAWGTVVLLASHDGELVQGCGAEVVDVATLR